MAPKAKPSSLVPAVAYLRKSTKGVQTGLDGKKRERQERSIEQQREEINKLAERQGYTIVRYYADPGVSGTRADRPDFNKMVDDAAVKRDFVAIICDDVDRFSRQNWDDVQEVATNLKKVGIKYIVTAAQGTYDLHENSTNLGQALKFVIDVWSSNQYSRKLGRRIALWSVDRAEKGNRIGSAPYGMKLDGKGGLVFGDPKAVEVVKRVFRMFVTEGMNFNHIMDVLNGEQIPSPTGRSKWSAVSVRAILTNATYAGDFVYGKRQMGKFHVVDADGEVVKTDPSVNKYVERAPVVTHRNRYEALIDRKMFNAAQKRVAEVRERFKVGVVHRTTKYALADILFCNHCGSKMSGSTLSNGTRRYTCSTARKHGNCACEAKNPGVGEHEILPKIIELFLQTRSDITDMLSGPPKELVAPGRKRRENDAAVRELEEIEGKLQRTRKKIVDIDWDAETAMMLQAEVKRLVAERDELAATIEAESDTQGDYSADDLERLREFWNEFDRNAISVPLEGGMVDDVLAAFHQDPYREDLCVRIDPVVLNVALKALGTKVNLQFNVRQVPTKKGPANRYSLKAGRYQLGQFAGSIPGKSVSKVLDKGSKSAGSETECDWTSASVDAKNSAVAFGDIEINALSGNEMRRGALTHLPSHQRDATTLSVRNVKDQRSAKFALDRNFEEMFLRSRESLSRVRQPHRRCHGPVI